MEMFEEYYALEETVKHCRCQVCGAEFSIGEDVELKWCPMCGVKISEFVGREEYLEELIKNKNLGHVLTVIKDYLLRGLE